MTSAEQSGGVPPIDSAEALVNRIGHLTRTLRDSMRELGLDRHIARAAEQIPDARDRLGYVAQMTERAAERALNAVDIAQPEQSEIARHAKELDARWDAWFAAPVELDQARELVGETRSYLKEIPSRCTVINDQLMEIMMAQDFQDLTGQVIKKMMEVVHELEMQLVQVLLDNVPIEKRVEVPAVAAGNDHLLNGPQYKTETPADAVSGQDQVDDLLASLGF